MAVIETKDLVKQYGKTVTALRGVSLTVEPGQIYGLLGRNGAGKTTMVKILLGIVKPTDGSAILMGEPAGSTRVRYRVGFLPEDHRFPEYHTAWSLLDFYGALLGVPRSERRQRIPAMLEMVNLDKRMHTKIRTYSKGMKQRVGIAQALLHNPDVLFLDEPTDGVDPVGRREIRKILTQLKERGKTIFLNSHMLGEVEMISDRVAILERGELLREGTVESLTMERGRYEVGLLPGQVLPTEELERRGFLVRANAQGYWEVSHADAGQGGSDDYVDELVDLLRSRGLSPRHLMEKRFSLEEIFMATVDKDATNS